MTEEDKRAAVSISLNLSTQIIAAALALLAVEGAYAAYALGGRQVKSGFIFACILSATLVVASIFIAGKGITAARNAGYNGLWDLNVGKRHFNWQAILCLLALMSFGVALLLSGPSNEDAMKDKVLSLQSNMINVQSRVLALGEGHNSHEKSIAEVRDELSKMEKELNSLTKGSPKVNSH